MTGFDQPPPGVAPEASAAAAEPQPAPEPPPAAAPEPPKSSGARGKLGVGLLVIGGALGAVFVKFVLPLILVGVAGEVIGVAFGGPYMRLPGDVRQGFESRLERAVGNTIDDLSDAEQAARIQALVDGGLPRLGDSQIDTNFRLASKAITSVDDASCATLARAIFAGTEQPEDASTKMVGSLSDSELQQWFEIRVAAIEAEVAGAPAAVVVGDDDVAPLYDKLFDLMNEEHLETIQAMSSGATVEDAAICAAVRGLYTSVLTLAPDEVTLFARYDISP